MTQGGGSERRGALRMTRGTQNDAGRTQNAKTGTGMTGPANVISLSAVRFSPESPEILRCAQNDKEEARNSRPEQQTFSLSTYRAPPHPPVGQRFFASLRMTKRKLGIQDRTGRHSRSQPTELHRTRLPGKVFAALRMTKRKLGIQDRNSRHSRSQPTELHRTRLSGKDSSLRSE